MTTELEQKDETMEETNEVSYLDMSDEDVMNSVPPETKPVQEETIEEIEEDATATADEDSKDTEEITESNQQTKEVTDKSENTDDSNFDYKSEYQRILAPFKANGREIKVDSVDDAISLMQMGANYNKKMEALKPNLRLIKMLENNGLLDEDKLSYLIDLDKKNPEAINKLVKDSGLDPLDLNTEEAKEYKPVSRRVNDLEIELDTVLEEIQHTDSYTRTLGIVSKEWDTASKQTIGATPQLLKVINTHVQSGVYDLISKTIDNERTFGRLQGLSDIEAYRQVGDQLHAKGAFDHLVQNQGQQVPTKQVVVPKPKMGNEDKLRDKRRAASAPQVAVTTKTNMSDKNMLALSDDEFSKLASTHF